MSDMIRRATKFGRKR